MAQDPRVASAISHWAPRFVSNGVLLADFEEVTASLEPGAAREVSFTLGPEELRMLDRNRNWVVEPGVFRVLVGASSKDIRLRGELTVK